MRNLTTIVLSLSAIIFLMTSCYENDMNGPARSNALGLINQITVIADDEIWDGPVGDSVRLYYQSAFPIMPQPEPYFELRHYTYRDIETSSLRRELRTYLILADLQDTSSQVTKLVQRDLGDIIQPNSDTHKGRAAYNRWAIDQMVIYLYQDGKDKLAEAVATSFPNFRDKIHEHDAEMLDASTFAFGENRAVQRMIREQYGVEMKIPGDYVVAKQDDRAMWLRRISDDYLTNLILYKKPYSSQEQLSMDHMIDMRDSLGRYLVSTSIEGSYMRTDDVNLPTYEQTFSLDDHFVKELKGVWEMEGDFYGGPYFFYGILSPDQKEVFYIDAFILAPGEKKKRQMQYLDHIARTARFK